ncbi:MAG: uroporphyrinogen-III synthase, partial [Bacteroidales bacterium]
MRIKNILISQPAPNGCSPYEEIREKHGLVIDFIPFIRVEGLSAKDFRAQRINILDHTAVVFTSRSAIDTFFSL